MPWVLSETEAGRPIYVDANGAIVVGGIVQGSVFTTPGVRLNQGPVDLRFADLAAAGYDVLWVDELSTGYEFYIEDQHEGSVLRLSFASDGELTDLETAFIFDSTTGDYVDVGGRVIYVSSDPSEPSGTTEVESVFGFSYSDVIAFEGSIPLSVAPNASEATIQKGQILIKAIDPSSVRVYVGRDSTSGIGASDLEIYIQGFDPLNPTDFYFDVATQELRWTVDTTAPALVITQTNGTIATDGVITTSERSAGVTLSGTTEAGSSVTIATGTGTDVTVSSNSTTGAWTATVPEDNLPTSGTVTFTVSSMDVAGNIATVTRSAQVTAGNLPTVQFSQATGSSNEGNSGSSMITV